VAETLRSILQYVEGLEQRGWARSRARDYYEIWRLLGSYGSEMELTDFQAFLAEKCAIRDVTFSGAEDFFRDPVMAHVEKTWTQWLGPLVPELPAFELVVGELRREIAEILA